MRKALITTFLLGYICLIFSFALNERYRFAFSSKERLKLAVELYQATGGSPHIGWSLDPVGNNLFGYDGYLCVAPSVRIVAA